VQRQPEGYLPLAHPSSDVVVDPVAEGLFGARAMGCSQASEPAACANLRKERQAGL
jgi:hypothetical protein